MALSSAQKRGIFLLFSLFLFLPSVVFAGVGVGVGIGKINLREQLNPGGIYDLPLIGVVNTGDVPSDYELTISYHEQQPELRPELDWFKFEPALFHLDPGKVENVKVTLVLPVKAKPGDYFAYVEAHPVKKTVSGVTAVSVAAAAKLNFSVVPSSWFGGVYYRLAVLASTYKIWLYVFFGLATVIILVTIFKKFFSFQIGIKKNK